MIAGCIGFSGVLALIYGMGLLNEEETQEEEEDELAEKKDEEVKLIRKKLTDHFKSEIDKSLGNSNELEPEDIIKEEVEKDDEFMGIKMNNTTIFGFYLIAIGASVFMSENYTVNFYAHSILYLIAILIYFNRVIDSDDSTSQKLWKQIRVLIACVGLITILHTPLGKGIECYVKIIGCGDSVGISSEESTAD